MTGLLQHIAFVSMPGTGEWIMLLVIGLLIFGRRLPEVARNLGKSVNEFKKGIREFQDSADEVSRDVNKITSEVASDVKDATGIDDYGYQEPSPTASEANPYDYPDSGAVSDADSSVDPESTDTTSEVTEGSASEPEETPAIQDEQDPYVEPMK